MFTGSGSATIGRLGSADKISVIIGTTEADLQSARRRFDSV
jgi:hypothetical protein